MKIPSCTWIAAGVLTLASCASQPAPRDEPRPDAPHAESPPTGSAPQASPPGTAQEVESALRAYVQAQASGDGVMPVEDAALPGRWAVRLVRVHPVRIVDVDHAFACVDFEGTLTYGGTTRVAAADLDLHLSRSEGGPWQVTRVDVHKQDGQDRERPFRCASNPDIRSTTAGTCPLDGTPLVK